jgi:O-antigen ligase
MLIPIAVYLTKLRGRRWLVATLLLLLGALASGSRTAITMLLAQAVLYFIYKRRETLRILPLLAPAVVVVHGLLPGAIGGFRAAFFPKGGIIAQQSQLGATENGQLAGGRIRLIGPMVAEASRHPLFGEGMGTRITGFNVKNRNAPILDNQWLNTLLDVGYIGFGLWIWLFVRAVRKLLRRVREAPHDDPDSWLFLGLAAAILSFAIGMLTFDAFGYTQIFFIFWILLGISASLLAAPERTAVVSRVRPRLRPATG